jgi:DNA-3-methyladenine glycosylase
MFGPPGHLYVYFSYGVHWCANVVCGPVGRAHAVLLRALEPVAGLDLMRRARWRSQRVQLDRDLCRGPGRLCQALGVDGTFDGSDLVRGSGGLWLAMASDGATDSAAGPAGGLEVIASPRIGLSVAKEQRWRFSLAGHPGVSGPRLRAGAGSSSADGGLGRR